MKRRASDASDGSGGGRDEPRVEGDGEADGDGVTGFADSMARLLGRRLSGVKQPILAKRKTALMKAAEAQRHKEVKDRSQTKRRKEERRRALVLPGKAARDTTAATKEAALRQVATKGVVALFNAIRKHQKVAVPSEADAPASRKAKTKAANEASKESFLSLLQQSTGKVLATSGQSAKRGSKKDAVPDMPPARATKKRWAALDDNYMMGAHVKDWDADDDDGWSDDDEKEEEIEFDDEVEVE